MKMRWKGTGCDVWSGELTSKDQWFKVLEVFEKAKESKESNSSSLRKWEPGTIYVIVTNETEDPNKKKDDNAVEE